MTKCNTYPTHKLGYVPMTASTLVLSWRTLVRNIFVLETRKLARRHPGGIAPNVYRAIGAPPPCESKPDRSPNTRVPALARILVLISVC